MKSEAKNSRATVPPSDEDVCRSFPDLSRARVYECLAYYEDHGTEIDALVAEQMREEIP